MLYLYPVGVGPCGLVLRDPTQAQVTTQSKSGGWLGWVQSRLQRPKPARHITRAHSTRGSLAGRGATLISGADARGIAYSSGRLEGRRAVVSGRALRTPSAKITLRRNGDPTDEQLMAALELLN